MRKYLFSLFVFLLLWPPMLQAAEIPYEKAAFTRDGHLFLWINGEETMITDDMYVSDPTWSSDGNYLAYKAVPSIDSNDSEIQEVWILHIPTNKQYKLSVQGSELIWSPTKTELAVLSSNSLYIAQVKEDSLPTIHSIANGVWSFVWAADGSNVLLSKEAVLFPDGWSHPRLYTASWVEKEDSSWEVDVNSLFTAPSPITVGDSSIQSISMDYFRWSSDLKWLAMIITPTASLSEDSNIVGAFAPENKVFIPLGEMLYKGDWLQWAPSKPLLATIQGSGRLQTGFNNKKLTIQTVLPMKTKVYTPEKYADINFTWVDDGNIIVARGLETSDLSSFKSSLYLVDIKSNIAKKLVNNPNGTSDDCPVILQNYKSLSWIRSDENGNRHVYMSELDGQAEKKIINKVDDIVWYVGKAD